MSKREVIAYAITHAPRGQKGGPYEADDEGTWGTATPSLRPGHAVRWRARPTQERDDGVLRHVREVHPHARVIRIVRKARPSEASAVEVLRELVAYDNVGFAYDSEPCGRRFGAIVDRARVVLAASGPDPAAVVRAALRFVEHCTPALEGSAWFEATREFIDAVDAYRKAGGK